MPARKKETQPQKKPKKKVTKKAVPKKNPIKSKSSQRLRHGRRQKNLQAFQKNATAFPSSESVHPPGAWRRLNYSFPMCRLIPTWRLSLSSI